MDVYSGAVHVVDDVMYDMLDYTLEPFMAEAKCPDYIKEGLKDKYSEEELEEISILDKRDNLIGFNEEEIKLIEVM